MGTDAANDKYSGGVELVLARSRRAGACLCVAGLATLAVVHATPLALRSTLLLATLVACSWLHAAHAVLRVRRLAVDHGGAVSVDGMAGSLQAGSFVAPWLTIVRWRPAGARVDRTVLVLPDMLDPSEYRHLRVILRWGQTT
jgi:toxin CptA